jgi:YesN/AraC family two-component response regulator
VYTAANGAEGIARTEKIFPQVVITDLMMPEADGFEVCRKLRSNIKTSHIAIVVISALGKNTENKIKALENGANVFIDKPFDMEYLLKQVDNLIKNQIELKEAYSKKYVAEPSKVTISSADEELLGKALKYIEQNISNIDYNVESFVSDMGIGRTLLYQKINDILGMSIKEFIIDIRLKRGAQLLQESELTIAEISDQIGFNNPKYFSICFKKQYNVTPTEFRKKP